MPRSCWLYAAVFLCVVWLGLGTSQAVPLAYVLRFSDTLPMQAPSHGRIPQLGERWHSSGNALRFWSHSPCAPKEESSRCYA